MIRACLRKTKSEGRKFQESSTGQGAETAGKTVTSHLELVPPSPALKLPPISSASPAAMGRASQLQKYHAPSQRGRVYELPNADTLAGQSFVQSTLDIDLEGRGNLTDC